MKVLCIGNSFSTDATAYLSRVAASAGVSLETYNLYIGGCSLARHWKNVETQEKEYLLEINGASTGKMVSIQDMMEEFYDVITVQQASHFSTNYETYQPYLKKLIHWLREHGRFGELVLHQTWAYEEGSRRLMEEMGYQKQEEMFLDLKEAYACAAKECEIQKVIPSGQIFQNLLGDGIGKIHRDTFHALIPMGRYVLALVWFSTLTGISPKKVTFCPGGMHETLAKAVRELVGEHLESLSGK